MLGELERRLEGIGAYVCDSDPRVEPLVERAVTLAREAHEGQFRNRGRPYLAHAIDVAEILIEWRTEPRIVLAGLLHDVVRFGHFDHVESVVASLDDSELGRILRVVNRLPKYDSLVHHARDNSRLQNILDLMANEVRAVLVRCANRLADLRAPDEFRGERREALILNSYEVYLPLLDRLGIWRVRSEVEERLLALRAPERYARLERWQTSERARRARAIERWRDELHQALNEVGLATARIEIRSRGAAATLQYRARQPLADLDDLTKLDARHLFDTHIITERVAECYLALSAAHACGPPAANLFRDYVAQPKPNGYASLHTAIVTRGEIHRVAIRSAHLDRLAEWGILLPQAYASWHGAPLPDDWAPEEQRALERFITELRRPQAESSGVFTPDGELINLPRRATVLDFAYAIHSDLGRQSASALVNGQPRPLHTRLSAGDVVEIRKDPVRRWPEPEWLDWVVTNKARESIQQQLRRRPQSKGRRLLDKELRRRGRVLDDYLPRVVTLADELGATPEELFISLANGDLNTHEIVDRLLYLDANQSRSTFHEVEPTEETRQRFPHWHSEILFSAPCCTPRAGEPIAGYMRERGIELHREECPELINRARVMPLRWRTKLVESRLVEFTLKAVNRKGLINDLTALIRDANVDIHYLEGRRVAEMDEVRFTLEVTNELELGYLVSNIQRLKSVNGVTVDGRASEVAMGELRQYLAPPQPIVLPFSPGKPVWGRGRFWGRHQELSRVETLLGGEHPPGLLVRGPRRIGKTSLLRQLRESKPLRDRYRYIYVDLQSAGQAGSEHVMRALARRLSRELDGDRRVPLPAFPDFRDEPEGTFLHYLDALEEAYPHARKRLLLALDEFGTLIEGVRDGVLDPAIFTMLRSIMQHSRRLTLLLCTSDDVAALMDEHGLFELLNVTQDVRLGHLDEEAARQLVQEPLRGEVYFEPEAIQRLLLVTDHHPFYLQILCANLVTLLNNERRRVVYRADIDALVDRHSSYLNGAEFTHLWQRDLPVEREILRALAAWPAASAAAPFSAATIRQRSEVAGERLALEEITGALERLARAETLVQDFRDGVAHYHIRIELFRRWLTANLPLHHEGQPVPGRS